MGRVTLASDPDYPQYATVAANGEVCKNWAESEISASSIFAYKLEENYCRSAEDTSYAWCFTESGGKACKVRAPRFNVQDYPWQCR